MQTEARGAGVGRIAVRGVLAFQAVVLGMYLLGGFGLLLTAAVETGDHAGLADPGLHRYSDPKDYIPPVGPDSLLNPLAWIFGISRVGAMLALPLAGLGLLAGLGVIVPAWRGGPRRVTVAAGTVCCAALLAMLLTPYGLHLQTWLLD